MKKTWIRRHRPFFLLVALCVSLSGCDLFQPAENPTFEQRKVTNPSSKLLGALMTVSDFSSDWIWRAKSTLQDPEVPTDDNHRLVESALSGYAGDYGPKDPYISIRHILKRYEQPAPLITSADIEANKTSSEEVVNLTFNPVGQSLVSECVRGLGLVTCMIVVKYNFLNSYLLVDAPEDIDIQTLQVIVNQILTRTDSRIREIDK